MAGCFYGAEVVASGDDYGVDAVIDAFVVGSGTVSVNMGDVDRFLVLDGLFSS